METYSVNVTKDYLIFCAAHFITFGGKCERLHGHNYKVAAEIVGDLDEDFLVVDFIALKAILRCITDELDHRVVLPRSNPVLKVDQNGDEVVVGYGDTKRWVFPADDCAILDIANTTAELLARWIAQRLQEELAAGAATPFRRLVVEVEETPGQSATYTFEPERLS